MSLDLLLAQSLSLSGTCSQLFHNFKNQLRVTGNGLLELSISINLPDGPFVSFCVMRCGQTHKAI